MPSPHPRIAVTRDPELAEALERARMAMGSHKPVATLVRELALRGADEVVRDREERVAAVQRLLETMRNGGFELDNDEIEAAQMRVEP